MVLDRPEIPPHTNGAENDIRCHVTKRKVSGGTWSEPGRDARDAGLGLIKTCQKLGVSFFDYLGDRLAVPGAPLIAPLPELIRAGGVADVVGIRGWRSLRLNQTTKTGVEAPVETTL